jgi:hypothetical protein
LLQSDQTQRLVPGFNGLLRYKLARKGHARLVQFHDAKALAATTLELLHLSGISLQLGARARRDALRFDRMAGRVGYDAVMSLGAKFSGCPDARVGPTTTLTIA